MRFLFTLGLLILLGLPSAFAQNFYGGTQFGLYSFTFSLGFGGGEFDLGLFVNVRDPQLFLGNPLDLQVGGVLGLAKNFSVNGGRASLGATGQQLFSDNIGSGYSLTLHYVQEKSKSAYVPLTLGLHPGYLAATTTNLKLTYSLMLSGTYEYDEADQGFWREDNFDVRPGIDLGFQGGYSFGEGLIQPVGLGEINLLHYNLGRRSSGDLLQQKVRPAVHIKASYVSNL